MIIYIETQLNAWGRWASRQAARAVGYPRCSPMFREMRTGQAFGSQVPFGVDEYVQDTDLAVNRLSEQMRALAVECYQIGGNRTEVARRMGIAKRTLYNRIDTLHGEVMGHLNDIAAETEPPDCGAERVHRRVTG